MIVAVPIIETTCALVLQSECKANFECENGVALVE